jgi:hypothetical protein
VTRRLDAAEFVRARTFLVEITKDLLPEGTKWRTEGNEWRAEHSGGLSINTRTAEWRFWGSGIGGYSPLKLIAQLRPNYPAEECVAWLLAWLKTHPGVGSCTTESDDDGETGAPSPASVARAREALDTMQRAEGTLAEVCLRSRAIEPPYPDCVGYIEDARCGEGALVAVLTAHDRVVGVQLGYLTPDGQKSLISPQRERFNLERQPGAVFRLPASPEALAGPRDPVADYLAVEGIEDALTLRHLDRPCAVIGLPGINALAHLELPKKSRVVVFEDGDEKGSPADRGCVRGIDHLINAGMYVWTVPTPLELDANAILTEPHLGIEHLRTMLRREHLFRPSLSFEARVAKLAKLDGVQFAQERSAILKIFKTDGITAKQLDDAVKKLRPRSGKPGDVDDASAGGQPEPPPDLPWPDPLPPLSTMLDTAAAVIPRFLVAAPYVYDVMALWTLVTHLVHSAEVALPIMPQLAFQSRGPDSGKSTALEITATLSFRGQARSSYTAATLFRRIAQYGVTFCLSELHNILTEKNTDMRAIVDACHRRSEAFVDRTETDSNGRRYVMTYPCWAALAWGSIGPMVREVQSRAIVLPMQPALPDEYHALDHSSPSQYPTLIDTRRQYAAWAATINQPLDHVLPRKLFNRLGDNWRPLISVAALAGERWLARALAAMEEVGKVERSLPQEVRLLTSITAALKGAVNNRLSYADLIDKMCEEEEAGWTEANRGGRITAYWLRENLRGLGLNPRGSQEWQEGKVPNRTHVRGYELHQFDDPIRRYVPTDTPSATPPQPSGTSGTSATVGPRPAETAEFSCPGSPTASGTHPGHVPDVPASGTHPGQEKAREFKEERGPVPVVPDVPDTVRGGGESVEGGDPFDWARSDGVDTSAESASESASAIIRRHLDRPGSFVLVTMVEGSPRYSFEDGTPVTGRSGKALTATELSRLDLVPVEGESLLADGSPQRYVLHRQAETSSMPLAEKLAEKLGSGPKAPNGPATAPTVDRGLRRPMRKDTIRDAVLAYAREHPEWNAKDISKVVPRAASVIQRILDAALRDSMPEGTA